MRVTVVGTGYVGLSLATLLAQNNEVIAVDIIAEKVDKINKRISPIKDKEIETFFREKTLNLVATMDKKEAFVNRDYIIISTPTNYDETMNSFDTSSVEETIKEVIKYNSSATIVIKSTIPVGFTNKIKKEYNLYNVFFSPEFLREGKALYDNLYPSRIIVGSKSENAKQFAKLLIEGALKKDVPTLYTNNTEAEAIKLFANTYLALRVAYFNELDTYAELKGLNTKDIIEGVCLDPRIGSHYNNPSFGYGGYCLPKDTKQMRANFEGVPNNIIKAIVDANDTRKRHIAKMILSKNPKKVGIYRLIMKQGSDNFRKSAIFDVINILSKNNIDIVIYEPSINDTTFNNYEVIKNLEEFKKSCDLIVVNRTDNNLKDVTDKIYTRDLYERD